MSTHSATSTVTAELATEFVNTLLQAWATGDRNRLFEFIAEEVEYWDDGMPAPVYSKSEAREFFDLATAAISDFQADLLDGPAIAAEKGLVMMHFKYGGKLSGDFGELKANGSSFSVDGASLYEFRDGKVVRWRAMYNVAEMLRQLGLTG